jgi:hypothetical protein
MGDKVVMLGIEGGIESGIGSLLIQLEIELGWTCC